MLTSHLITIYWLLLLLLLQRKNESECFLKYEKLASGVENTRMLKNLWQSMGNGAKSTPNFLAKGKKILPHE